MLADWEFRDDVPEQDRPGIAAMLDERAKIPFGRLVCTVPIPPPGGVEWVSLKRLTADAITLAGFVRDCDAVAGVPRSGMLPAGVVATLLHLPLYALDLEAGELKHCGHGYRFQTDTPHAPTRVFVVDDSCTSGTTLVRVNRVMCDLRIPYQFGAVYSTPHLRKKIHHAARVLPLPHLFEWNFFNTGVMCGDVLDPVFGEGVGLDLDGVLLHDELSGGVPGTPYLVPKNAPTPLIVTGRHERDRGVTLSQLHDAGCQYRELRMLEDHVPQTTEHIARFKAHHYKESRLGFFVESCPEQAQSIAILARKPVICPQTEEIYRP